MSDKKINDLKIDEWIWVIFIIISALNIFGDEYEKDYYTNNDFDKDKKAKKIFTFTVFISFIIYSYFVKRNYQKVKSLKIDNCDSSLYEVRLIGSIFVVVGVFLLLYFQLNETNANNPSAL